MHIQEKNGSWLNFFTPAMVLVAGAMLAGLIVIPIILIDLVVPILGKDSVIANLSVGILSQVIGTVLVISVLIPLAKVKDAKYHPISKSNTIRTGQIFCVTLTVVWLSNLVFAIVYSMFNQTPKSSYQEIGILLTADHLSNPFNIVLFLSMGAIAGPVFEEYLCRRTIIPMLEKRGMAPFAAVFASSLVFALSHVPNDLLFGNVAYLVQHFWGVFLIGLACGIAYVLTRNVIFPIIIHGAANGLGFISYILSLMEDLSFLVVYGLFVLVIVVVGLVVGVFAIRKYMQEPVSSIWVQILQEQSPINIVPGLLGFVGIISALYTVLILGPLSILLLSRNGLLTFIGEIVIHVVVFVLLIWLVTKTEYVGKTEYISPRQSTVTA